MNKPTCRSCPYWDQCEENELIGTCNKRSPAPVTFHNNEIKSAEFFAMWPHVWSDDFCGEHPDFPAYIKHLKEVANGQRVR